MALTVTIMTPFLATRYFSVDYYFRNMNVEEVILASLPPISIHRCKVALCQTWQ